MMKNEKNTDPKIKTTHLDLFYGENHALKDICMDIRANAVTAFIGPSGCGKSTFLRSLNQLEKITSGCILFEGVDITGSSVDINNIRRKIGMVFQQFNLFPHFSVLKNVCDAPVVVEKRDKAEVEKEARELIEKVGLKGKEDSYPCQLSGGQQQRVAIARALAMNPEILFFDEPTSALDPELTGEVLKVIRSLAQQNTTMIIVTHELAFARDVADQVIFMDGGVIVEHGDPHEVIDHPKEERTRQFLTRYANG